MRGAKCPEEQVPANYHLLTWALNAQLPRLRSDVWWVKKWVHCDKDIFYRAMVTELTLRRDPLSNAIYAEFTYDVQYWSGTEWRIAS